MDIEYNTTGDYGQICVYSGNNNSLRDPSSYCDSGNFTPGKYIYISGYTTQVNEFTTEAQINNPCRIRV